MTKHEQIRLNYDLARQSFFTGLVLWGLGLSIAYQGLAEPAFWMGVAGSVSMMMFWWNDRAVRKLVGVL